MKTKHLVDFRFQIKQGLSFEDFKYKVSEVWESESVQEAKSPEKASSKPRRTVKLAIKAEEDAVKSKIKVDGEDTEKKEPENAKPNPKRKYARRRPTARRGAQRGRHRRPSHTSKREEGTPVDNATPEPKDKTILDTGGTGYVSSCLMQILSRI